MPRMCYPAAVRDWHRWHDAYDDPASSLSRRLAVVRRRIDEVLSHGRTTSILSLCAGDGRDVIPALAAQRTPRNVAVTLVEADPALAAAAAKRAAQAGVPVDVVVGDAGAPATWAAVPPVDLLLLCGIFGNISPDDIRRTIRSTPQLLAPGGVVIWTRGGRKPDLRRQVRQWFRTAGLDELSFDQEPEGYGVGVNRRTKTDVALAALPDRLFTFEAS